MNKKLKYMPTAIFLCVVFVLTTLFVALPKSEFSSSEKRILEKFPETNLETITNGKFEKGFENYIADHFPFRNMWVGINTYYNYIIGNNGNKGVYKSGDDYLINAPVSSENRIVANSQAISDFSKNIDVPVTVMVAPSTGYIMNDKLPALHNEYIDDTMFENLISTLDADNNDNLNFVDLRDSFKQEAEKGTQLYYRTDHHWTTEGAYLGYSQLCKSLKIKPTEKSDFKVDTYGGFYGTTYSTSGFWLTKPDDIQVWNNKNHTDKNITVTITEGDEQEKYHNMYFLDHLEKDDKYPVFLDGNHAVETIKNSQVKSGKALIVKDSFCHSLAPFLADNFNTVTMVDMRYYKNSVSDIVKKGKYDQVFVIYGVDNLATDTDLVWIQ